MEDEASHYGSEENSSDVDSSGEQASSDFEPSSGENDGSDGDHASGENNASMVSTSGDAFDVENDITVGEVEGGGYFKRNFDDVVQLLDGPYNYGSQQLVEALNLQNVDPKLRVRKGDLGPTTSQINSLICRTKLEEAKTALLAGSSCRGLLAQWDDFGPVTLDQLQAMIKIKDATATFRDVELTTAWIDNLQWPTASVMAPFGNIESTIKDEHKRKVEDINLGETFLEGEIFEGTKLLQWREEQWLNTTCITATLMALRERYWNVGIINPCYARFVQDKTKKQVAASFGAFRDNKDRIIGCINLTDAHWVAFHINPSTRLVRMFDPQQSQAQYAQIKVSVSTIEPLLHEGGTLTFERIDWCAQRDGHSCGV
ncbi:hypothetical protein PPTG_02519 [Phytophthora nicotianae INRA-310]|uniref:Ubiquitin-like protease family profile domain-containing protein n=1 Tax=Phytophthora nicotianae (strain INRA-310) TaxID=761204 RepID=W2RDL3_PHYN3|nr:hypothetical protein PPTG_02519 [Phytophthora nicotianae INRA-310]ETN22640.1 hypothetical protein PPTG_02519 [Phytophthora nicotianae INRA-310]